MLRKIRLYGELGKKFGRVHEADINSVGEALRYLDANFKGFLKHIVDSSSRVAGYEVWDGSNACNAEVEDFKREGSKDIKIIPRISGAGAAGRIIGGIVLMVVGYLLTPVSGGSSLSLSSTGASMLMAAGASLVIGGVIELLSPKSNISNSATESSESYTFSGAMNSTKQGNPVMIGYGEYVAGSQVISATITTEDISV